MQRFNVGDHILLFVPKVGAFKDTIRSKSAKAYKLMWRTNHSFRISDGLVYGYGGMYSDIENLPQILGPFNLQKMDEINKNMPRKLPKMVTK